jgi:two-component system CheB/CheR fusion protein
VVAPVQRIDRFLRSVRADVSPPALPPQHSPEIQYLADQATSIAELVDTEKRLRSQATDSAERLKLLLNEMDHRVKNNLAAIVGLVQRGKLSTQSASELADELTERIMSMSRTHEALAAAGWEGVSLSEDLPRILEASAGDGALARIHFLGPAIMVPPSAATALCMALSELVMNARKHGALSVVDGRVELDWKCERSGLYIDWREQGGPAPGREEKKEGAGLSLVRGLVEYQLKGSVQVDFRPEGFAAMLEVPLAGG